MNLALLTACANSLCFFADTDVTLLGIILPLSETYLVRTLRSL